MEKNKNYMRGIWNILNSVIKNGSGLRNYPKYFLVDDKEEYNMDVVANCFNNFFVNIGSDLAEKNPDQGSSEQSMEK